MHHFSPFSKCFIPEKRRARIDADFIEFPGDSLGAVSLIVMIEKPETSQDKFVKRSGRQQVQRWAK